jgi:hypothetical protein
MTLPTQGEQFAIAIEHLRKAQEAFATLAHLTRDDSKTIADAWLKCSELMRRVEHQITDLARGKWQ